MKSRRLPEVPETSQTSETPIVRRDGRLAVQAQAAR
jgi:hypothetical protein